MFIEFGKTFWSDLAAHAGVNEAIHTKALFAAVGKTSSVTPFRAFRFGSKFVVMVEPTHCDGAYVSVFETREQYDEWYKKHMHIDIKNRDM